MDSPKDQQLYQRGRFRVSPKSSVRRANALFIALVLVVLPAIVAPVAAAEHQESGILGYDPLRPTGNGFVQHHPKIHLIFVGDEFNTQPISSHVRSSLTMLFQGLAGTQWNQILTQYYDRIGPIADDVSLSGAWVDVDPEEFPSDTSPWLSREWGEAELSKAFSANGWVADRDAQFIFVFPPGATHEPYPPFLSDQCAAGGYESISINDEPMDVTVGWIPSYEDLSFRDCFVINGITESEAAPTLADHVDMSTYAATHEFAEMATNPDNANGWGGVSDRSAHEIADPCEYQSGDFPGQRIGITNSLGSGTLAAQVWDKAGIYDSSLDQVLSGCSAGRTGSTINEHPVPISSSPQDGWAAIAVGPPAANDDGYRSLWVANMSSGTISQVDTMGHLVREYVIPDQPVGGSWPTRLIAGPDGNVWFTKMNSGSIGRINPGAGSFEPDCNLGAGSTPLDVSLGADGNVWFTDPGHNRIGFVTRDCEVQSVAIPTPDAGPTSIIAGPHDKVLFTESMSDKIGILPMWGAPLERRRIREVTLDPGSFPNQIVDGPQDRIWFTSRHTDEICSLTPGGHLDDCYQVMPPGTNSLPASLVRTPPTAPRPDNLWFTLSAMEHSAVGELEPATRSVVSFPRKVTNSSEPWEIVQGPDGKLWFAEQGTYNLGSVLVGKNL